MFVFLSNSSSSSWTLNSRVSQNRPHIWTSSLCLFLKDLIQSYDFFLNIYISVDRQHAYIAKYLIDISPQMFNRHLIFNMFKTIHLISPSSRTYLIQSLFFILKWKLFYQFLSHSQSLLLSFSHTFISSSVNPFRSSFRIDPGSYF